MDLRILISNSIWNSAGQSYISCSVQNLTYISINVPSIHYVWVIDRKQNFNQIQGEIISTISATELEFLLCAVPYINIYLCSKYQSIQLKNIWVIVRKQNFNQNVNPIQGEIISTIRASEL